MFQDVIVDFSRFDWQGVSAISDVLMFLLNIILFGSVLIGYKTLKESARSRDAQLLTWAMDQMTRIKDDLQIVRASPAYGSIDEIQAPDFTSPWDNLEEEAAYRVSIELQRLAYLTNSGLISQEHFKNMWGPTFVSAWNKLETWVKKKRLNNNEPMHLEDGAYSRNDFERFALECAEPQSTLGRVGNTSVSVG